MYYLEYIIPVLSVLVSYFLGRLSVHSDKKTKALQHRYETFYVPYMQFLVKAVPIKDEVEKWSIEGQSKPFDLIMNHAHLLGSESNRYVSDYYFAFLNWLEAQDGNLDYEFGFEEYPKTFHLITKGILKESSEISKKLKYPDLAKEIVLIYYG